VAQALFAPLFVGGFVSLVLAGPSGPETKPDPINGIWLATFWATFYGCALHSAGFFMNRGIKLFGWIFIAVGCALFLIVTGHFPLGAHFDEIPPHLVMGGIFGGLHLAYGVYLYFTEPRKNAT
jgi:hypothetical protein